MTAADMNLADRASWIFDRLGKRSEMRGGFCHFTCSNLQELATDILGDGTSADDAQAFAEVVMEFMAPTTDGWLAGTSLLDIAVVLATATRH